MDLTPYIAKGFPGKIDEFLPKVGVKGIDYEQANSMVRVCAETERFLYEGGYSARKIRYRAGSRPRLEAIVRGFSADAPRARAEQAMTWVHENVRHPFTFGKLAPDRALTEEQLIDSGKGWCNEQARVFIALCEVQEVPARLCFLFHANLVCGHTTAEAFVEGRWAWFDPTFNLRVELPGGKLAEGRELSGRHRPLAHAAYRPALEAIYKLGKMEAGGESGWGPVYRPSVERGGDLLACMGVCNYVIEGVAAAR